MELKDVKHCTMEDIGITLTGADAPPVIEALNGYLKMFAPPGKCPRCDSDLGGLFGSFTWGLCHGEGYCTGSLEDGRDCQWPCRGKHRPKRDDGDEIFTQALPILLPYHPDGIEIVKVGDEKAA